MFLLLEKSIVNQRWSMSWPIVFLRYPVVATFASQTTIQSSSTSSSFASVVATSGINRSISQLVSQSAGCPSKVFNQFHTPIYTEKLREWIAVLPSRSQSLFL